MIDAIVFQLHDVSFSDSLVAVSEAGLEDNGLMRPYHLIQCPVSGLTIDL